MDTNNIKLDKNDGNNNVVKKEKKVTLKSTENLTSNKLTKDEFTKQNKTTSSELISFKSSTASTTSVARAGFDYSYLILAASFFAYMLASLLSGCFGVFFENMESDLGWTKTKVAFIGGLISAMQDLTGPISSALTNEFGCRKTAIFGGLIASLGMIGSAYVNEFWLLGFLMGGVSGFGTSLVLVSSVVVVTYYFEEKPSFAAGLTISGGSLGQSIFSLIIIKLNEVYGRSGCYLILGGILLNIIVCAALFRPLKWELEDENDDEDDEEEEEDSDEEDDEAESDTSGSKILPIEYDKLEEGKIKKQNLNAPCAISENLSHFCESNSTFNNKNVNYSNEEEGEEQENLITVPLENPSDIRNFKRFLKSTTYLNLKSDKQYAFLSDSCLPYRLNNKQNDFEQGMNNSIASTMSLKSNLQLDEIRPVRRLRSCAADSISLSRCHSLEFRTSRSETTNLKPNSSVPTDLQSLGSNLDLDNRDFITESKKNELELDVNEEYVVVDADDIANCGSNLILSKSQNAIYFPIMSNQDQDGSNLDIDNQLVHTIDEKHSQRNLLLDDQVSSLSKQKHEELTKTGQKPAQQNSKNVFSYFLNKLKSKESSSPAATATPIATNQNQLQLQSPVSLSTNQAMNKKRIQLNVNQMKITKHPILINKNGQKIPHKKYIIAKCSCKQNFTSKSTAKKSKLTNQSAQEISHRNSLNIPQQQQQQQHQQHATKPSTKIRHFPTCPFYYINLNRVQNNHQNQHPQSSNHPSHTHNHHQKANLYRVPNLFQNSYRFPLHFRNVYYYKSLLNLNMRIMVLRPHGAGALTVNAPTPNINNVSLSCPDLHLKQILIVKKNTASNAPDSKTSYPVLTIKDSKSIKKQFDLDNLKSCSGAKVLNAGSIILMPNSGSTNKIRRDSFSSKKIFIEDGNLNNFKVIKLNENKNVDLKKLTSSRKKDAAKSKLNASDFSLTCYNDKIVDNHAEEVGEDESESEEEDEESSEEEDSDEEEEDCDNCLTRTKCGNYLYKYLYKPIVKPLKFIYYSIAESLKLFRLFKFCVFAFCNFILSFFYEAPFYFINSFMIENGLSQHQAGTVTVAVGIVSVFSSIVYGYIGDSKKVNSIILYSVSLIICGLCCCAVPLFITNYWITMILMILIGALISVSDVLVPIICVNIVGYDDFVNAYGLMFFCQGLASFSGPPILGVVIDKCESYTLSFYLIGVGICISGLVLVSILFYDKIEKKKATDLKLNLKKLNATEKV